MDVTRLAGVALASALMFSCADQAAPGAGSAAPDGDGSRPPVSVHEAQPEADEMLLEESDDGGG